MTQIKQETANIIAYDQRPRERLVQKGAKSLANHELLAILLRTGTKQENVYQLALRILNHFASLNELKQASLQELKQIKGIGPVKAIEMQAAIELGARIQLSTLPRYGMILSSQEAGQWMVQEMADLQQEHLIVLCLNSKNEVIKKQTIFMGSVNSSIAHPREIFKEAVKYPTAHLIIAHNHPSGNPDPSKADLLFTKRMISCGEMMGIDLLDHLIIGSDHFISLREATDLFD